MCCERGAFAVVHWGPAGRAASLLLVLVVVVAVLLLVLLMLLLVEAGSRAVERAEQAERG